MENNLSSDRAGQSPLPTKAEGFLSSSFGRASSAVSHAYYMCFDGGFKNKIIEIERNVFDSLSHKLCDLLSRGDQERFEKRLEELSR